MLSCNWRQRVLCPGLAVWRRGWPVPAVRAFRGVETVRGVRRGRHLVLALQAHHVQGQGLCNMSSLYWTSRTPLTYEDQVLHQRNWGLRHAGEEVLAGLLQENLLDLVEDQFSEQPDQLLYLPGAAGLLVGQFEEKNSRKLFPRRHEDGAGGPDVHQGGVTADKPGDSLWGFVISDISHLSTTAVIQTQISASLRPPASREDHSDKTEENWQVTQFQLVWRLSRVLTISGGASWNLCASWEEMRGTCKLNIRIQENILKYEYRTCPSPAGACCHSWTSSWGWGWRYRGSTRPSGPTTYRTVRPLALGMSVGDDTDCLYLHFHLTCLKRSAGG